MTKDNCTPIKWHYIKRGCYSYTIFNPNDENAYVCDVASEVEAQTIIRAVNRDHLFEELVKALQSTIRMVNRYMDKNGNFSDEIIAKAENTLSKASKLTEEKSNE